MGGALADPVSVTPGSALGGPLWKDSSGFPGLSAPPLIIRIAGLPAQAIGPLESPSCLALLEIRETLETELAEARQSMVALLGNTLLDFDAALRRFLLAVKRDCFNGRRLGKYREKPEWAELLRASADLAPRILYLEEQLAENDQAFNALFTNELARERRHVLDLVEDRRFLRGVALGRPGLVQQVRSRAAHHYPSEFSKNPEKWELSLLRFVTRAATKLSANSTLTVYALGSIQTSPTRMGFHFVSSPRHEISLVRVNRPELDKLQVLLMRYPALRKRALVAWNDSVEEIAPDRYRFLQDGQWKLESGTREIQFVPAARITTKVANPLLGMAREALREGALRYEALLALDPQSGSGIDQLIDLGILILLPPWPTHEAWLERRIAQFLRELPHEPALSATMDALEELLVREEGFASAQEPEKAIASLEEAFSRLLDTASHLAGHEGPLTIRATFFEDVLFVPTVSSSEDYGIFKMAEPMSQEILQSADLVSRFASLFNHRHDILHTLATWWRGHEPDLREARFTEIAQGFLPTWKQFLHFHKTANQSALNTFNPLQAAALEILRERREKLLSQSKELLSTSPTRDIIPQQKLNELLETLPHRYAPLLGSCVFVQPVDAEGSSWVLNRLHEGTGRYLSRITPILEGPLQQRFIRHLLTRSVIDFTGEEADLLEIMYPWGGLVNAHTPQALRVLDIRGLNLDLPQERRVNLGDLLIQADLDSDTFRLTDRSGRRVLPVHLSSMTDAGLPPLLRFLLAFGPGETRGVFPFAHSEGNNNFRSFNRLTCGKLVLRRHRWAIGIQTIRANLRTLTGSQAYGYIHNWHRHLDLPSRGFYYERTYHGAVKPQYVDFDSPSLCTLFASSLQKIEADHLILEEALPSPADFPFDSSMNRRCIEVLIDSLALRTVSGLSSLGVADHNRENISQKGTTECLNTRI